MINYIYIWKYIRGGKTLYRIEEASDSADENTNKVLVGFMKKELEIEKGRYLRIPENSSDWEEDPSRDKPCQIITRFLQNLDREKVMSTAKKLKGKNFCISADLPKEIVD